MRRIKHKILFSLQCLIISFGLNQSTQAQLVIHSDNVNQNKILLSKYALIGNAKDKQYTIEDFLTFGTILQFEQLPNDNTNLGFTTDNYWVKFEIENQTDTEISYYLEAGRPITDLINLYQIDEAGKVRMQTAGDAAPMKNRTIEHRKNIFEVILQPKSKYSFYLHLTSDGEVINLPLILYKPRYFLSVTAFEQIIFGVFYGILLLASITFLFFFFAIKDQTFIYYVVYVVSLSLLHFSLDGYFFQFIDPNAGWLSSKAVILFGTLSAFLMAKYSQVFLKIKEKAPKLNIFYKIYFAISILVIASIIISKDFLVYSYPAANLLGLIALTLTIFSMIYLRVKDKFDDVFYAIGIFSLALGFVIFILNNFSIIPNSFFTENGTKFGTGLEVIFLSLSLSNRIRKLRSEKEEAQYLAYLRSQETNEVKNFFLSNMSHELRTPLNAIVGLTQMILDETNDKNIREKCEIITYSSYNLLTSVNDILDFSQMEKGDFKLSNSDFDAIELLKMIAAASEVQAKDKHLKFNVHIPEEKNLIIHGDPTRLSQILNNILGNAIKFTPVGEVDFEVIVNKKNNVCHFEFIITDTGIGIPKSKLDRVFEPFMQVTIDNKRSYGGFGLGLCIVKSLLVYKKGKINLESTVGKGTKCTINVSYPIVKKAIESQPLRPKTPAQSTPNHYDLKGNTVLVVEDNPVNALVLRNMISKWENSRVLVAGNGKEALEMLKNEKVDLIIMDLQMPVMDGYECTTAIRNGDVGAENSILPIIALTADVVESSKLRVFEVGMDAYFTKPFDQKILFDKITELLSEKIER